MDIVSLPIEHERKEIDSRFRLVAIAAQRARELAFGARPKVDTKATKSTTQSIEETLEGKLEFVTGDEAREKLEEAKKFDYKRFLEEKRQEAMPEDLSELEKDLRAYLTERDEADHSALEELFASKDEEDSEEVEE